MYDIKYFSGKKSHSDDSYLTSFSTGKETIAIYNYTEPHFNKQTLQNKKQTRI